jgi:hypothetical protein
VALRSIVGDEDGLYGGHHRPEGIWIFIFRGTIRLRIGLARIHQRSINGQMEKELLGLSPGNINGVWKSM